ncbi:MAG: hypothetical protein QXM75_04270 [Candidatus Diapherotrites archaeon]
MTGKKQKKSAEKLKKKKWYKVYAPKMFKEVIIGETPAEKEQQLIGRTVEIPLANVAGQKKPSPILVKFRINNTISGRANTELVGCRYDSGYLRRIVRRRKSKIDVINYLETADKKRIKIVTTVICLTKIERKKETKVRNTVSDELSKEVRSSNFEDIMQQIIFGNMIQKLFNLVKNIAPVQRVEIVKAYLVEGKKE